MIESLHSPHIARVKALIGSRGVKERRNAALFVAEGIQSVREAITFRDEISIDTLYLTSNGRTRLEESIDLSGVNTLDVSDEVMAAISETITPQGILAICASPQRTITQLQLTEKSRIIYLSEIQDPGNAGTIIRSADAMGMNAIVTSPGSVDLFSPKVVRSTAGSLWHIPVFESIALEDLITSFPTTQMFTLGSKGAIPLPELHVDSDCIAIFGNEARGISTPQNLVQVSIPMPGNAESLNLSAAASIVMYHLSNIPTSANSSR
jgi:TrmH family RNA methyltransferase